MALSSLREWDIRGLNLKFFSYDRVRFFFNSDEQKTVLLRLFLQKLKPKTGSIIIPPNIHIYSEKDLWMRIRELEQREHTLTHGKKERKS